MFWGSIARINPLYSGIINGIPFQLRGLFAYYTNSASDNLIHFKKACERRMYTCALMARDIHLFDSGGASESFLKMHEMDLR